MKIFVVYGTRPELIKVAPLILKLRAISNVELTVVSTGQHKEMLTSLEALFEITPDVSLDLMTRNQTVNSVVSKVIGSVDDLLQKNRPDLVFVQGDTATVLGTAMACYYAKVKVAHIEAGLRSFDLNHPFPEEFNRKVVSIFADYNFAPTQLSADNLLKEGVDEHRVFITGNTVIDALNILSQKASVKPSEKKIILVTAHRRENHGEGMIHICNAMKSLLEKRSDVEFIWPLHPNPNVKDIVLNYMSGVEGVQFTEPMDYIALISTMKSAHLIWTDSGGIQEEVPSFRKPLLILREVTERPEVVSSGFGELTGTNTEKIISATLRLLSDEDYYNERVSGQNPFGDGHACDKILSILSLV
ncbi:UDP-N-acetylglucosamine 2-epimerase (non-hydrolyzing) [Vicingaceae bacterium]|nr:UDP-N-acetylglucosamine 2-epimerase (non-hydrolyzing) [Vicingaceae bacterium]